jgi:hypothetical protein
LFFDFKASLTTKPSEFQPINNGISTASLTKASLTEQQAISNKENVATHGKLSWVFFSCIG